MTGRSQAKSRMMSAWPRRSRSSQNRVTTARTTGSMADTLRGVNAPFTMRRTRVWPGGSALASVGTAPKPDSLRAASGHGGVSGERAFAAENTAGARKMLRMSS